MLQRNDTGSTRTWLASLLCVAMTIPLWLPAFPPLIDLPGHMGHFRIMAGDGLPSLTQSFQYEWRLYGNVGANLLMIPLGHLLGIELGTKVVVLGIVLITSTGILWVSREVHGRISPTALFALSLVYSWPFRFGFLNYCLSLGLVFNALALWLYLARTNRLRLRFVLFIAIAWIVWLAHTVGWGLLCLTISTAELARRRGIGQPWLAAL